MKDKIRDRFLRVANKARTNVMQLPLSGEDFKVFPAHPGDAVIEFNSACMEVVDYRYSQKGEMGFWLMVFISFALYGLGVCIFGLLKMLEQEIFTVEIYFTMAITFISFLCLLLFLFLCIALTRLDFWDLNIRRVRFNRKNQRVYFLDRHGELQDYAWKELVAELSTISRNTRFHAQIDFFSRDDQERYDPLFILGFYKAEFLTACYWEFIRSYMEEDVVEELAEVIRILEYCPKVEESFNEGWAQLIRNYMDSRADLVWLPVMMPYTFVSACWRWLGLRTSKPFIWPEEVDKICAPEPDDPVQLDASLSHQNRMDQVFLSFPKEYYLSQRHRMEPVHQKIVEKLSAKYGG